MALLFGSALSIAAGALWVYLLIRSATEPITGVEFSRLLFPFVVAYSTSVVLSLACLSLAFIWGPLPTNVTTRRLGILLSWANALNAFPIGLLTAITLHRRVWKPRPN